MSICIDKLSENISSPCTNPLFAGKRRKGWLFNRADISSYTTDPLNDHIVDNITLASGAKGYFIQADVKLPFNASVSAMNEGDYTNDFTHNVVCYIPNDGADWRENIVNKIANGEFVVVLENKWTGNNGDNQFQIFGLQQGLLAVSDVNEDAENGGWNFTLQENGTPMSGMYYWHTDEETSRNDLDALAGGGGGEDWTPKWFYIEDASGSANTLTIKKNNGALQNKSFEWSEDKQHWTSIDIIDTTGVTLTIPANGRLYFRGDNEALSNNSFYTIIFMSTRICKIGGDLTTLLYKQGNVPIVSNYAWGALFQNIGNKLITAEDLIIPCVQIGEYGLWRMFAGCIALLKPCKMPNLKRLSRSLFNSMYYGCTLLQETMGLPSDLTGSANSCFNSMYANCTSLTDGGTIPALGMTNYMFTSMYQNCTNLNRIVVNMTTWTASNASDWLSGVAATGDFYNLGGATFPTGTDGIPSGWTEHTALP